MLSKYRLGSRLQSNWLILIMGINHINIGGFEYISLENGADGEGHADVKASAQEDEKNRRRAGEEGDDGPEGQERLAGVGFQRSFLGLGERFGARHRDLAALGEKGAHDLDGFAVAAAARCCGGEPRRLSLDRARPGHPI